ncbi:PQQ-binding-like beta-propeller repeat protein [Actinoallomurus sp. NPDC050550]|uniref:protein kinase domain-containing protein n=1 Tax=Actinoallomurus sp. NPDC050550 TaxID=3154937 RepID=UPI0033ED865C
MAALEPGDPGHVGRYRLLSRLGEGGMGRVYLGASPAGRAVAIKVVRPELAGDPMFRARFRAEVEAARKVSGAFTSPVVDADPEGTVPWLATAYVNGLSLKDAVERYGPMPEDRLRTLGAGLGEALIAIHRTGLLHRDLKPANILLAKDGPRVIDFGISRATDGTRLTAEGQAIGSPGYMSPEQIRGKDLAPAGDVFAFGAVLAFAATGRPPYGTGPVHTVIHRTLHQPPDLDGVPQSLAAMVAACLSTDPGRRPPAALLPQLLAAPPLARGWLPDAIDRELQQREHTLVLDLRAVARARTRRRLLLGGAAAAGLAVVGGGTAVALAETARSGRVSPPRFLWRATPPATGDITAPQVFARTVVVFGFLDKSTAFDATTGRKLWSAKISGAGSDNTLIYAQPAQSGDFIAMDPYSRAQRWSFPLPSGFNLQHVSGPAGGLLGLADRNGTIIGLDVRTGKQMWTHHAPAATDLQGIQGGSLIAASGKDTSGKLYSTLFALDPVTGAVRWTRPYATPGMTLPGSGDLVFSSPARNVLDALSAATGRTVWTANVADASGNPGSGSLTIAAANGMAYLGGAILYALDLATGQQKWAYEPTVSGSQDRTFLVKGKYAYVLDNRHLIALDARTGRRLWSANTPADDTAPLVAIGGLVCTGVAGTTGPGLYGWNAVTGRLVWSHPGEASDSTDQWTLTSTGPVLAASQIATLLAFRFARA